MGTSAWVTIATSTIGGGDEFVRALSLHAVKQSKQRNMQTAAAHFSQTPSCDGRPWHRKMRNPKAESRKKTEGRDPRMVGLPACSDFGVRPSFGFRGFALRIWGSRILISLR